jgi:hypothetical protein
MYLIDSLLFIAYILPYLRNYYGNVFSVAELLVAKYASFLSSGIPVSTDFNIEDFENHGADWCHILF